MKIKYLHHSEIDYDKWEACVGGSLNVSIYSHSWFLDCLASNWGAVVMDDYRAVMPVFFRDCRMLMPKNMLWTGIYSPEILGEDVYKEFLTVISARFKYVDISLDKFFKMPALRFGRVSKHFVYQFDVVKDLKNRISHNSNYVKTLMLKSTKLGFTIERVTDPLNVAVFMQLNSNCMYRDIDLLERIIVVTGKHKNNVMFQLRNADDYVVGFAVAVFVENYIYVPLLKVTSDNDSQVKQMVMLYHLMSFFEGCPGSLVIPHTELNLKPLLLTGMGARRYEYQSFHVDLLSKFLDFFKKK